MFSDDQLAQARSRVSLYELIGRDVALKRKGREWQGLCPFHNEKSPSFFVVPDKEMFHCFGCGAHGGAIDYVMRSRNLDFKAAVAELLELPVTAPQARAVARPRRAVDKSDDIASARATLAQGTAITQRTGAGLYLWSRGLDIHQPGLRAHPALMWSEEVDGGGAEQPPWRRWYSRHRETWVRGTEFPALLAPMKDSAGHITAVHQIWCSPSIQSVDGVMPKDGRAPVSVRKKTRGDMRDGCVRLAAAGPILGLAEGVETGIAAMMLFRIPVWVMCGVSRLGYPAHWAELYPAAGRAPLHWFREKPETTEVRWVEERAPTIWIPDVVEHLVVLGDNGFIGRTTAGFSADWYRQHRRLTTEAKFPRVDHLSDFNEQLLDREAVAP